jgi:LacI family transcriptional regulator
MAARHLPAEAAPAAPGAGSQRIRQRPSTPADIAARAGVSESTVFRVLKGSALVAEATRQRIQSIMVELDYLPSEVRRRRGVRRTATIGDVAARAGVGEATVSRVLNGSEMVRQGTRERVQEVIDELHYRPSLMARGLSQGRTTTLGVIAPFFFRASAVERLRGVVAEFTAAGYDTVLYNVSTPEQVREQFENVVGGRAEGILVISVPPPRHAMERLMGSGTPLVLVDVRFAGVSHVYIDNVEGGRLATRHLLELGHRRIGFIGDFSENPFGFTSSADRCAGFRDMMGQAGLDVPPGYIREAPHSREAAALCASDLLALPGPPTAIFAGSDTQALGVLEAAARAGVDVPGQLSVIGFDDIEVAAHARLTTIRQPLEYSGARGAELLLRQNDGWRPQQPLVEEMPVELVVRGTTAAPPR